MAKLYIVIDRKNLNQTQIAISIILSGVIAGVSLLLLTWHPYRDDELLFLIFAAIFTLWVLFFLGIWFFRLKRFKKCSGVILVISELGIKDYTLRPLKVLPWANFEYIEWKKNVGLRLIPTHPNPKYKIMTSLGLRPMVFPKQYFWLSREEFILFMDEHFPDKYRA